MLVRISLNVPIHTIRFYFQLHIDIVCHMGQITDTIYSSNGVNQM